MVTHFEMVDITKIIYKNFKRNHIEFIEIIELSIVFQIFELMMFYRKVSRKEKM